MTSQPDKRLDVARPNVFDSPAGRALTGASPMRPRTPGPPARKTPGLTRNVSGVAQPVEQLLSVDQAGRYLGTGPRFIRRLIAERRIDYVKIGKFVRIERSTLDAFIDAGRVFAS